MIYKEAIYPCENGEDQWFYLDRFKEEIRELEAQGWVMAPESISTWYGGCYGIPDGCFQVTCTVYEPDDPETAELRANRVDLQGKEQP